MATTIKLKNGSGAPLAGDLVAGEPALDLTNKRLYTEDSGGTVIEVGTNPTSLTTGTFTSTGIDDNATSTAITINSSQNVGIGTTSPNAYANYTTLTLNGATSSAIDFEGGGTLMAEVFSTANDLVLQTTNSDGELIFKSAAGIEAARINSSGNVGIGLTPSAWSTGKAVELGFQGNALWGNAADEVIVSQNAYYNSGWKYATTRAATHYSQYNAAHRWFTAPSGTANSAITWTQAMTLDSSGRLGIGTTSPAEDLSIVGSVSTKAFSVNTPQGRGFEVLLGDSAGSTGPTLQTNTSAGFNMRSAASGFITLGVNAEHMRIDSSGNLLVGRTSISGINTGTGFQVQSDGIIQNRRDVNGGSSVAQFYGNAGSAQIKGDGDLENTNNSYGAISDERLKSNIVDASSQIDDIMAVQVRSYTLNETGATHIGVVAQELEASGMSGLVKTDDEGMKSVKYSILYMKAIKALQEAVTRIETLEAEVAALKGA